MSTVCCSFTFVLLVWACDLNKENSCTDLTTEECALRVLPCLRWLWCFTPKNTNDLPWHFSPSVICITVDRHSNRLLDRPGHLPGPAGGLYPTQDSRVHPAGPGGHALFPADVQQHQCPPWGTTGKVIYSAKPCGYQWVCCITFI